LTRKQSTEKSEREMERIRYQKSWAVKSGRKRSERIVE